MLTKMKPTLAVRSSVLIVAALLGGCSLMPDYERPAAPVAASWPTGPAYQPEKAAGDAVPAAEIAWRDFYADARLRQVIELALANNRDLRVRRGLEALIARPVFYELAAAAAPHPDTGAPAVASNGVWYSLDAPA